MAFDTGHALVIGIGEYPSAPPLNVAQITALDAQQVAKVLMDAGFCAYPETQVRLLNKEQATRANILAELDRLGQTTRAGDTVFLFYSGHGLNDADGHYNLTTYDTTLDANHKVVVGAGISEQELLDKIKQIAATRALLVFNACHSGAIRPMTLGDDAPATLSASTGQNLPEQLSTALLGAGEGRVIITACRETQSSYFDRSDPATLFAQTLSNGLQGIGIANHKNTISLFDLYEYVFTTVSESAKQRWSVAQEPVLTISQGVGIMPVALYQGKNQPTVLGEDDEEPAPDLSRLRGQVKSVDPQASRAAFQQVMSGKLNLAAGGDVKNNTITQNDVAGPQTNIDHNQNNSTGTQNIAGRDIYNMPHSQGVVINSSGAVHQEFVTMAPPTAPGGSTIAEIVDLIQQAVARARASGNGDLADDLSVVATDLDQAIKAQQDGKIDRYHDKLAAAQQDIAALAKQEPSLATFDALLRQLA